MSERKQELPRVLLVSHNVLSRNTNNGRTMGSYFAGWEKDRIAQLFFQAEVPTDPLCENYFRYTDQDALKSLLQRNRKGRRLGAADIEPQRPDSADTGALAGVYNYGRKRSPLIYLGRDGVWRLSGWKNSGMREWISEFDPEVLFFVSGDYAFPYRIVSEIAKEFKVPYVVCCYDDYYLFNRNQGRFLGNFRQKQFMKTAEPALEKAARILTLNDSMAEAYRERFQRECTVLHMAAAVPEDEGPEIEEKSGIAFLGGLGLGREMQLVEIAGALAEIKDPAVPKVIDVYSGEQDPGTLSRLTACPGIRFHGAVAGDQVAEIIRRSRAVIHTESFDPVMRGRVRYSLSTKIPESLGSGTCLLAYGPAEAASMEYLRRNEAAFTATSREELRPALEGILTDGAEYRRIRENARALARKNHDSRAIRQTVREVLAAAAGGERK